MQTILVVEDELSISDVVSAILSYEGHRVVVAHNGQEALVCLESEHPDLILSDVMMPVMGGRELCKRLQANPEHRSVPVILMSSLYNMANLEGCMHAAFIAKPFNVDDLLLTVRAVIGA